VRAFWAFGGGPFFALSLSSQELWAFWFGYVWYMGYSGHGMNHHSKRQGVAGHGIDSDRVDYCILSYQLMWILHGNIELKVKHVDMIVLSNVHYNLQSRIKYQDIRSYRSLARSFVFSRNSS
jgi:hypothetical protein